MTIATHSIKKQQMSAILLVCIVAGGLFAGRLLSIEQLAANSEGNIIIDDFLRKPDDNIGNIIWAPIADQKIGDDITRQVVEFVEHDGRTCLHIKGQASSTNKTGTLGVQADLTHKDKGLNIAAYDGIYVRAKGTRGLWTIGLWIQNAKGTSRLYQAPTKLEGTWQQVKVPFSKFRRLSVKTSSNEHNLMRIAIATKGQQSTPEIFMDEIGLYRGQKMYRELTPEEEQVIIHKGTEKPFSGKYNDNFVKGVYTCKQCGAELFESSSKFKSGCGWPSFDDRIEGAVKWQPDADGYRTEIICAQCGAHLGHVFMGEGLTPKNVRYCVNSISMDFVPAEKPKTERAIFASGCFWGTEFHFQQVPGVISTTVGYTGGHVDNPTYEQVCTNKTGHAEAVEVIYDPSKTSYEQLAKLFFETHDFTQLNRQGPDVGTQYRSAIFYVNEEQKQITTRLVETIKRKGYDVKTQIVPADKFWPAENFHQDYYAKSSKVPYCHTYRKIF